MKIIWICLFLSSCASWDVPDKQDPRYCPNNTTNCHIEASKPDTLSFYGKDGKVVNQPLMTPKVKKRKSYRIPKELIIGVDLDLTPASK